MKKSMTYGELLAACDRLEILQHKLGGNNDQQRKNAIINLVTANRQRVTHGLLLDTKRTAGGIVITLMSTPQRAEWEAKQKAEEEERVEAGKRFAQGFIKP